MDDDVELAVGVLDAVPNKQDDGPWEVRLFEPGERGV